MRQGDPAELQIPAELAQRIKALYQEQLPIPFFVDELVLAKARAHLERPARSRIVVASFRWVAAAAVVTFGAWLGSLWFTAKSPATTAREDINQDGRVDILDAFALARRLQQGAVLRPLFDFNGDGVVDQKDIDAVAARAVKLGGG